MCCEENEAGSRFNNKKVQEGVKGRKGWLRWVGIDGMSMDFVLCCVVCCALCLACCDVPRIFTRNRASGAGQDQEQGRDEKREARSEEREARGTR